MQAVFGHLTTHKSFYVEISRARHGAELVTGDAKALRESPGSRDRRVGCAPIGAISY